MDGEAGLRGLAGRLERTSLVILAVSEYDEMLVLVFRGLKAIARNRDGIGDARPWIAHDLRVHRVEENLCGAVIYGQRAVQECCACEGHDSDAISLHA